MNKKKIFFGLLAVAAIYLVALFPPKEVVPSPTFDVRTDNLISEVDAGDYESRIQAALAHEGTEEDPIPLDMDFLGAWELDETLSQPFPPHVLALDGRFVSIRGFMLPDVDFEHIRRFHMVRSLWGCCFGAPPRMNEIVLVEVPGEEGLDYTYNTLEIGGTLSVVWEIEDGLVNDLYRLEAATIRELGFFDPDAPDEFDPSSGFEGFIPSQGD